MFEDLGTVGVSLAYVLLGVVVLLFAKLVKDVFTPYKINDELTARDNVALGLAVSGYFAGVIIIFLGAVIGPDLAEDLTPSELLAAMGIDAIWALAGVLALNVGRWVVDKLCLPGFSTTKEIIEDKNAGTGAVEMGAYVATALTIAGAIHGVGGGPLTALAFFGLGQLVLVLFVRFYQVITRYDIHAEIERDNVAAGVALGLSMVAIGIILLKATSGDFVAWGPNLGVFAFDAVLGFVVLMVLRRVTDVLLLPSSTIAHEIAVDRNLNAAWIEGVVAMGLAAVIFFLI